MVTMLKKRGKDLEKAQPLNILIPHSSALLSRVFVVAETRVAVVLSHDLLKVNKQELFTKTADV